MMGKAEAGRKQNEDGGYAFHGSFHDYSPINEYGVGGFKKLRRGGRVHLPRMRK